MNVKRFLSIQIIIFLSLPVWAQQAAIPVFISGTEGHQIYRIPAIVQAPNGDLLAFAEGRVNGADDFGDINIVMKRSHDLGKTWSSLSTLVDFKNLQAGNPAPVVDLLDPFYPNGRIFLFYNTGNNNESEIRKGNGIREVWYKTSVDEGKTWSEPVNITLQVHKPNQPKVNPAYSFSEDWRHYANTPGHAMQFSCKPYQKRIYIPACHSEGNEKSSNEDYFAHGFYTDDHGKTFHLSATINLAGSNECSAAELSYGGLLLNIRNQKGDVKARIVAISKNGGETWDSIYFDKQLPDPVCEGSILNICKKKGKMILAFCNAADTTERNNLTLRISQDEGVSWPLTYALDKNPSNKEFDYSAYSDLVKTGKHKIGILYEKDDYSRIVFRTIEWK